MSNAAAAPIVLGANQIHRFYRGGSSIARFRGLADADDYAPEDWVGSTTPVFGSRDVGLSRLPDGRLLRDAIAAAPESYLGPAHVQRFGADPHVLVKLLDAGERLPAHFHPDAAFARRHLGSAHGKTEAWLIVDAEPGAAVHVGFARPVDRDDLRGWIQAQDGEALVAALRRRPVAAGDAIFVPAGAPHVIGAGIFMAELQEPTDFSILLEWKGFDIDGPKDGHLGLGFNVALEALDTSVWRQDRTEPRSPDGHERGAVAALLPAEADSFFRAERIGGGAGLPASYAVIVVLRGDGELVTSDGGAVELHAGKTVLVPWAAGDASLEGSVEALRCLTPDPAA